MYVRTYKRIYTLNFCKCEASVRLGFYFYLKVLESILLPHNTADNVNASEC